MVVNVVPLKFGVTFKRVFSDPKIFSKFVSDVLDLDLHFDEVHTEYQYPEPIGFIKTEFDLFAEDVEKRIIVEIQHVAEGDFYDRFLYYHMVSLVEQAKSHRAYSFDRTVYTIVVLTSTPRDGRVKFSVAVSDMNPFDQCGEKLEIYPHRLVFLAPRLVDGKTPEKVKRWLEFILDSLDSKIEKEDYADEPTFQELIDRILDDTTSPEELSKIKDQAAWLDVLAKGHAKGLAKGHKKGLAKGLAEGRAEGEAKGKTEGDTEATKRIALAMLEKGLAHSLIAETTGLELDTIGRLKI